MLRHAGDVTKIYLICFAVSVVLPVILIKLLGLMGAVVSYLAIMALLLVLLIIEYRRIRQRIERDRNSVRRLIGAMGVSLRTICDTQN